MTTITEEKRVPTETQPTPATTVVSGIVDADDRRGYLRTAGYRQSTTVTSRAASPARRNLGVSRRVDTRGGRGGTGWE